MGKKKTCQVCCSSKGEERNVSTGCILRLDLEKSLNFQLLVTVSSLAICSTCCNLITLWSLFTARARKNLAALSQDSIKSSGNAGGTRLNFQVLSLSKKLEQVLQSTEGPETCLNATGESSKQGRAKTRKKVNHAAISTSSVPPAVKDCSIVLDRMEVENYFKQSANISTSLQESNDEFLKGQENESIENSTSKWNSRESPCSLEMKIEIESEPPSPANMESEVDSAPVSFEACSSGFVTDPEDNWTESVLMSPRAMSFTRNDDESYIVLSTPPGAYEQPYSGNLLKHLLQSPSLIKNTLNPEDVINQGKRKHNQDCENKRPRTESMFDLSKGTEVSNMSNNHQTSKTCAVSFPQPRETKLYKCDICEVTVEKSSLQSHFKSILHKKRKNAIKGLSSKKLNNGEINSTSVDDHDNHHEKDKEFTCSTCHLKFRDQKFLAQHYKSSSHKKIKFDLLFQSNCDFCGNSFYTRQQLTDHIYTHLKEGKAFCYSCKKIFNTPVELINHVAHAQCRNLHTWQCNVCSIKLSTSSAYRHHVLNFHNIQFTLLGKGKIVDLDKKPFSNKCPVCNTNFRCKIKLDEHMWTTHQLDLKYGKHNTNLTCHDCRLQFQNMLELQLHTTNEHNDEVNNSESKQTLNLNFQCEICNKDLNNKLALETHMNKHMKYYECSQICNFCSEQFDTVENITQHIFTAHLKKNQCFCHSCNLIFNSPCELKEHVLSLKCKNLQTWQCNMCYRKLSSRYTFKQHTLRLHNLDISKYRNNTMQVSSVSEPRTQQQVTMMNCGVCHKAYRHKCSLNRHIVTHHKLKPKLAPRKGDSSIEHNTIMERKVIEESSKLNCNECSLQFSNVSELNLHIANIHKIEEHGFDKTDENHVQHNEKIPSLKHCNFCSKQFSTQHTCTHLEEESRCNIIFNAPAELEDHVTELNCKHPLRCQCNACSKGTPAGDHASETDSSQLKKHSFTRRKEVSVVEQSVQSSQLDSQPCFRCVICNELFDQSCHLQFDSHLVNEHNLDPNLICNLYTKHGYKFDDGNGKKYFECQICKASFAYNFNVRRHLRVVHKIALLNNSNMNYSIN